MLKGKAEIALRTATRRIEEAIRDNIIDYYKLLGTNQVVEIVDNEEIIKYSFPVPHPMLNRVLGSRVTSKEEAAEQVQETIQYYRSKASPFMWVNWSLDEPEELNSILQEKGFKLYSIAPGMAVELNEWKGELHSISGFEIKQVTEESELVTFSQICKACFGLPEPVSQVIQQGMIQAGYRGHAPIRNYVGYLDGIPVSTATSFSREGIVGIFNVATSESVRGKGIGKAITLHAVQMGKEKGCHTAVLQSTDLGYNIYKSIGFQDYLTTKTYLFM